MLMHRWFTSPRMSVVSRQPDRRTRSRRWILERCEDRTAPAGITVNTTADNTAVDGKCSLREALTSTNNNADLNADVTAFRTGTYGTDNIVFDAALFSSPQTITLMAGELAITDGVTMTGPGANLLSISGNNVSRVFQINAGVTADISGVRITQGNADRGGGIRNNGTLTVNNSTISGNYASYVGGGVENFGTVTVANCTFTGNSANNGGGSFYNGGSLSITNSGISGNSVANGRGGGIYQFNNGTVTVTNSTLSNNSAGEGGGISSTPGTVTIINSTLSDNTAIPYRGGGVWASSASVMLTNSIVSGNSAGSGGGLFNMDAGSLTLTNSTVSGNSAAAGGGIANATGGSLSVRNSTLSGNSANSFGGGIYNSGSNSVTVTNSTLYGNSAKNGSGGGIYSFGSSSITLTNSTVCNNSAVFIGGGISNNSGTLALVSTIVSGNIAKNGVTPGNGQDIFSSYAVSLNSCAIGSSQGFVGTGSNNLLFGLDLKLGALGNNGGTTQTVMPALDSPVRGKGSNPSSLTTDQRGQPRSINGGIDIGAVQVGTTSVFSIFRTDPGPNTMASSVSWGVNLLDALTGMSASNFTLTGPGATGASITSISGSGSSYLVTVATGSDGALTLNFANYIGLSVLPTNLPFVGQSYIVDKMPLTATVSASPTSINDYKVGSNMLTLTATYSEGMDTSSTPVFDFPVENPGLSFGFAGGTWTDSTHYQAKYNVFDLNVNLPDIDVRVTGGKDSMGSTFGSTTAANLIDVDTQNPLVNTITRDNPALNNLNTVGWTVTFSEPITSLTASNFSLFNGGLGGAPAITSVTGGGTTWVVQASGYAGEGTLGLYVTSTASVTDLSGNPLAGLPVTAPSYAIDPIPPSVLSVQINDGSTQRSRVTSVTVKFIELVSFSGAPANAFTLTGPSGAVTLAVDTSGSTPIQTVAKLTFSGVNTDFTSLKDGRYTLKVLAGQVTDLAGNLLDGDGNGTGGDDYSLASSGTSGIFRLYGDSNGDATVAANDFIQFRLALGGSSFMFDFDNDGAVAASDFIQFRLRFGGSI